MEIKAINIKQKDFKDEDDFFYHMKCLLDPKMKVMCMKFTIFNVISIKRLYEGFQDNGIMLNKGWMIMKYYNESEIKEKIISIIKSCISNSDEDTYLKGANEVGHHMPQNDI